MFMADWQCSGEVDSGETSKPEKNHEKNTIKRKTNSEIEPAHFFSEDNEVGSGAIQTTALI